MASRERTVLLWLLAALGIAALIVLRPFAVTLIFGASAALALYPVVAYLRDRMRLPSALASLLVVLVTFALLLAGIYFIGTQVAAEALNLYRSLASGDGESLLARLPATLSPYLPQISAAGTELGQAAASVAAFLSNAALGLFTGALNTLFLLILFALAFFYFLKDGARWAKLIADASPLSDAVNRRILARLASAVNGILRGRLVIAIGQGLVFALGFWIFRVPDPAFWGLIAGLVSIIPPLGAALIWIPAALYLALAGHPAAAIGFALWGLCFGLLIDNVVSPAFLGKNIGLPPILMLFGALGGLAVFGIAGILIGPVILSLFTAVLSIYVEQEK